MKVQSLIRPFVFFAAALVLLGTLGVGVQNQPQPATIGGCPVFPGDNIWNREISGLPTVTNSSGYVNFVGATTRLKADFGAGLYNGGPIGIPFTLVTGSQPNVAITYDEYGNESDPGPFPIPTNAPIEGGPASGGDRHVLVVNTASCLLYELYHSQVQSNGSWTAGSGATWNLNSNTLRPDGWTSADAAGLPILAGLVRYDEVAAGAINHAIRFTVNSTGGYIWPARHRTSDPAANVPPMGLRFRLKANVDISGYSANNRVILAALKRYGMIVADNGSSWFMSGVPDERWDNDDLQLLRNLPGSSFEVVDEANLQVAPNSGQALQDVTATPAVTATPLPTLAAYEFYDVPPGSLWYTYVHDLAQQGIVNGSGGYFRPNANTTRAEFAKMSVLSFGIAAYTPTAPSFGDVPASSIFYRYIEAAAHVGVITGYPDGSFRPNNSVSRAQVAVIVQRAKGWPAATPANPSFSDVPRSYFAFGAIEALAGRAVISGAACGSTICFRPNDNIRRGEVSKVLYQAMRAQ